MASTSPNDGSTSPAPEVTGTSGSTGSDATTQADESTGTVPEPLGCYEDIDFGNDCCPSLPRPCDQVFHECIDDGVTPPLEGPVVEPTNAQCMLGALLEGGPAVLTRRGSCGFLSVTHQWVVSSSGDVIRLRTSVQDFAAGATLEACELAEVGVLEACAAETDPTALSECLDAALVGCEPVRNAVCPS